MGGWRKLHNEELHNLYSSSNVIRMIKSMSMRWAGHLSSVVGMHVRFWLESQKERDHNKDLDIRRRMKIRLISER
jgi:hypothetical protein